MIMGRRRSTCGNLFLVRLSLRFWASVISIWTAKRHGEFCFVPVKRSQMETTPVALNRDEPIDTSTWLFLMGTHCVLTYRFLGHLLYRLPLFSPPCYHAVIALDLKHCGGRQGFIYWSSHLPFFVTSHLIWSLFHLLSFDVSLFFYHFWQ